MNKFALDIRETFPDETGFSLTNVKYMKRWYLFYYNLVTIGQQIADQIGQRLVGLLENEKSHQLGGQLTSEKRQRVVDELTGELEQKSKED